MTKPTDIPLGDILNQISTVSESLQDVSLPRTFAKKPVVRECTDAEIQLLHHHMPPTLLGSEEQTPTTDNTDLSTCTAKLRSAIELAKQQQQHDESLLQLEDQFQSLSAKASGLNTAINTLRNEGCDQPNQGDLFVDLDDSREQSQQQMEDLTSRISLLCQLRADIEAFNQETAEREAREMQVDETEQVDEVEQAVMREQIEETEKQLKHWQEACTELEGRAAQFEQSKNKASQENEQIRQMNQQVSNQQHEFVQIRQACGKAQMESAKLEHAIARLITTHSQSSNLFARALALLRANDGEMLLSEFKEKLVSGDNAEQGFQVLQTIYGLVADSLIVIDRSEAENRVLSLV